MAGGHREGESKVQALQCLIGRKVLTRGEGNRKRESREQHVYWAPMNWHRQKVLSGFSRDKNGSATGSIAPEDLMGR